MDDDQADLDATDDGDTYEIVIVIDATERDTLDALGFLEGHGDAAAWLAHHVTQLCTELADERDVQLVVTARRARTTEAR